MNLDGLPELPKKDTSLEFEKALRNSPIISYVYVLLYNNHVCKAKDMAAVMNKTVAQVYSIMDRMSIYGVIGKIPKKGVYYLKKDVYPDSQYTALKVLALTIINDPKNA